LADDHSEVAQSVARLLPLSIFNTTSPGRNIPLQQLKEELPGKPKIQDTDIGQRSTKNLMKRKGKEN
jgi:hypothetical protein